MTPSIWLKIFFQSLEELKTDSFKYKDVEWTNFMMQVLRRMAPKLGCRVVGKHPACKADSGEYLGIDAMFFDKSKYGATWKVGDWDPFILPSAIVELENDYNRKKIAYCLWKLLCIRCELRILICYQKKWKRIDSLKIELENIITSKGLMSKGEKELIVIIGDDTEGDKKWKAGIADWQSYLNVFKWNVSELNRLTFLRTDGGVSALRK